MRRRNVTVLALMLMLAAPAIAWAQDAPAPTPAPPEAAPGPTPAAPDGTAVAQPAQPGQTGGTVAPQDGKVQSPFGGMPMLLILGLGMVALFWWSSRSRRKQESKRKEMLSSLKKGDKATSIGGIIGTVIEVREDEVVLKVDENNNTRIHMARWAIRGVGDEARDKAPQEQR